MMITLDSDNFQNYFERKNALLQIAKKEVEELSRKNNIRYLCDKEGNIFKINKDNTLRHIKNVRDN